MGRNRATDETMTKADDANDAVRFTHRILRGIYISTGSD